MIVDPIEKAEDPALSCANQPIGARTLDAMPPRIGHQKRGGRLGEPESTTPPPPPSKSQPRWDLFRAPSRA
jgi:hypothetical protein